MLDFKQDLIQIEKAGLYRRLKTVCSQSDSTVNVGGRKMIMMASNDYLGLCSHQHMKDQVQQALQKWGTGSGASRLISGNSSLFNDLEKKLSEFKKTEDALVFSTGYMANIGLLAAIGERQDIIFSDELNHASIIDGCRLSRAHVEIYPHRDADVLESRLKKAMAYRRRIIITDGVFSMDGDIAPLPSLVSLAARYDAALIVDDAHGTGVLGNNGGGTAEHFALTKSPDIIMGTMGKAMGCFGAFVAGSTELKNFLINSSRSFIFTTALPPTVLTAALKALQIIEKEPERRHQLRKNFSYLRNMLNESGFNTLESETPIIPVMIGDPEKAVAIAQYLFDEGVFIQAIRPPTVPDGSSRLRLTVMATHTIEEINKAVGVLIKAGKKFGVI